MRAVARFLRQYLRIQALQQVHGFGHQVVFWKAALPVANRSFRQLRRRKRLLRDIVIDVIAQAQIAYSIADTDDALFERTEILVARREQEHRRLTCGLFGSGLRRGFLRKRTYRGFRNRRFLRGGVHVCRWGRRGACTYTGSRAADKNKPDDSLHVDKTSRCGACAHHHWRIHFRAASSNTRRMPTNSGTRPRKL